MNVLKTPVSLKRLWSTVSEQSFSKFSKHASGIYLTRMENFPKN